MNTGKNGYFDFDSFSPAGFTLRINWEELYEITDNLSRVKITSIQVKSANWAGYAYYPDGCIKLNGAVILKFKSSSGTSVVSVNGYNKFYTLVDSVTKKAITAELDIVHETDGSKITTLELVGNSFNNFRFYTVAEDDGTNGGAGWRVTGSKEIVLTDIPRASTISATDANIGAVAMIAVSRKSIAYTHSIAYKFGSLSGYITSDGSVSDSEVKFTDTSVGFKVPISFYAQIPDAKSDVCTLTVRTYSGTTKIGENQTTIFTATAAQSVCAPSVSGTVVDSNETTKALTGDESKLVRYCSTALCTISAKANNSATISQKKIGGAVVSGTTRSIAEIATDAVEFYAKDSRGYGTSETIGFELIPYVKLTSNPMGRRTDPTSGNAMLYMKGNFFNGSFGVVKNTLTAKYSINGGDYVAVTPVVNGNKYTAEVPLSGLDYEREFYIEIVVEDKIVSETSTVRVRKGTPVFDWGQNDFRFNVPVELSQKSYGTKLPDDGKEGQMYLLDKGDGTYDIRIHNGISW